VRANPDAGFTDPLVTFLPKNNVRGVLDFDLQKFVEWRPNWSGRLQRILRLLPAGRKKLAVQVAFTTEQRKLQVSVVDARINGNYVAPMLVNLGLRLVRKWKDGRLNVVDGIPLPWGVHHVISAQGQLRIGT
jgi:hypothetical protein